MCLTLFYSYALVSLSVSLDISASANGVCVEAGVQGYPLRAINRAPAGFMHPPYAPGHPSQHHPTQPLQLLTVNRPSNRIPTNSSLNTGINPTLDVADVGPTFLAPVPPTGFRLYRPHRREIIIDPSIRHRNLPHLRVLPEDVTFLYPPSDFSSRFQDIHVGHKLCS